MSFDLWIHILELMMVAGIAFVVFYTKRNTKNREGKNEAPKIKIG